MTDKNESKPYFIRMSLKAIFSYNFQGHCHNNANKSYPVKPTDTKCFILKLTIFFTNHYIFNLPQKERKFSSLLVKKIQTLHIITHHLNFSDIYLTRKGFCSSAGNSEELNFPDLQVRQQLDRGMIQVSDMCDCLMEAADFLLDL